MKLSPEEVEKIHNEMKAEFVDLCHKFTAKFGGPGNNAYPQYIHVMRSCVAELMGELDRQSGHTQKPFFSDFQRDFICYQIGDWYCMWKNMITDSQTHRLGYAKEMLKIMITGTGEEESQE